VGPSELKKIGPAVAILAVLVVPVVIVAAGGDGKQGRPDLRVERVLGSSMLALTIANELNTPRTAVNGSSVVVECLDAGGQVIARSTQTWPLPTDSGYDPHAHQLVDAQKIDAVDRCRIVGANKKLEAEPEGFVRRSLGHRH
jgi:hypothetical protein